MEKIDFVIIWVDGNDVEWQKEKNKYDNNPNKEIDACRFRDWEQLKYWFRGVEKYAPWVNKIYFVTCGQKPEWLKEEHPKLVFVDHKDYIDSKYLPTFSSHTIELNLHKIKGLSEQFVYFNDDIFIINQVKPQDFFKNGLPCDDYVETVLIPDKQNNIFAKIMYNDTVFANKYFDKRKVLSKRINLYFNYKYGLKNLYKNILMFNYSSFSSFSVSHIAQSYLKSTLENVWKLEPDLLNKTCMNKFRSENDVNQYVFKYWQYFTNNFIPRKSNFGKNISASNYEKAEKILNNKKTKILCINDTEDVENFEYAKKAINALLEKKFPDKSSFEK